MKSLYTQEQFNVAKSEDRLPCQCLKCEKIFYKSKHDINSVLNNCSGGRYKLNYCSNKCKFYAQITKQKINCRQCGKEFEKIPAEIKRSTNHFCSRSCSATYNNTHKTIGNRRSKLEIYLEQKLTKLYPDQKILFNDKTAINSELDIHFVDLKLAFELNGIFHYEPIFSQNKLDKIQNNDNRKYQACIEKDIALCIIDVSSLTYFKESNSKKYLDIIINIINVKLCSLGDLNPTNLRVMSALL